MPNANIVGNMMDMKNGTAITAYTAILPEANNERVSSNTQIAAYKESNLAGLIYFIKNVPEKRPTIKPTIAIDPHHNAASFSGRFITNFEKRIKKLPTHTCAPT